MTQTVPQPLRMIGDWSTDEVERFRKTPLRFRHSVLVHPETAALFSDDALAELIERHPLEHFDIVTMDANCGHDVVWISGRRGAASGADVLRAVREGLFWVNLRRAMTLDPAYKPLLDAMYAELAAQNPGFAPRNILGGILISSPGAHVPYHADLTEVILWHMRGEKDIWIYPPEPPYLADEAFEAIALKETEDMAFEPSFDQDAWKVTLAPGDVAAWPHAAPHRIANGDSLNVSVTTEYMTWASRLHVGATYTNGVIRRRFGGHPHSVRTSRVGKWLKFAAAAPLKRAGVMKAHEEKHDYLFEIDVSEPGSLRWLRDPPTTPVASD